MKYRDEVMLLKFTTVLLKDCLPLNVNYGSTTQLFQNIFEIRETEQQHNTWNEVAELFFNTLLNTFPSFHFYILTFNEFGEYYVPLHREFIPLTINNFSKIAKIDFEKITELAFKEPNPTEYVINYFKTMED